MVTILVLAVALIGCCSAGKYQQVNKGCFYNGQYYYVGQTFPHIDGCNTCTCYPNGQVSCTYRSCDKPGTCPISYSQNARSIACRNDYECPGNEKCCYVFGHAPVCVLPLEYQKPGTCPRNPIGFFPCGNDFDCPGIQKCCSNGGGSICTNPREIVKPGVCPRARSAQLCLGEPCVGDGDCGGAQKCCNLGPCRICRDPRSGKKY